MLDFATATNLKSDFRPTSPFALRDLLNGLFYYRRIAAIVFAFVVASGFVLAIAMPPTYRAEARLLPLSAGIYDMQDAGGTPQPGQVLDPAAVVNVELQMLNSLELHRAVVRGQMGQSATNAEIDNALDRFETKLHVTKASEANVIELTYVARDPRVAADALRDLIARYFDSRANVLTAGRVAFLEGQRNQVKTQLDRANAEIARYQQANGIVDITAQVAGAVAQDEMLHKNQLDTQAQLADGRKNLTTLQSESRTVPSEIELYSDNTEAAHAIGEMQTSLLQLQAKRADLASRYMMGSPQVAQVDHQIYAVQSAIKQQRSALVTTRRTGRNQFYDSTRDRLTQTQASVSGTAARGGELAAQIAVSGGRLKSLTGIADQLAAMKLDRDVLADTFKSLSVQVEQARVQLNQTTSAGSPSVRIIEAPTPPTKRSNPPLLLIAGSIVAALVVAGTTIFVLSSLRETFLSPQEVERALGVPVLCAPIDSGAAGPAPRDFGRLVAAIDAIFGRSAVSVLLLAPSSRGNLQDAALGLGRAIERRSPGSVALIRFGEHINVPKHASEIAIEMIDGMATGVIGINACSMQRLDTALIAELKAIYPYVIITAPPTTEAFESIELAQSVDLVVPVVGAETSRRPVVRAMLAQLGDVAGTVLGVVLVGRRSYMPHWLYRLTIDRNS